MWPGKRNAIILNIQQNLNFPAQNWRSGFCFGFCNEENWVPHCKTLAQLTPRDSKTEKDCSKKGKHRVIGKENSNFDECWRLYISVSSTEPPLDYINILKKNLSFFPVNFVKKPTNSIKMLIKFTIAVIACIIAIASFVQALPVEEIGGVCVENSDCREWCNGGQCDYWRVWLFRWKHRNEFNWMNYWIN